MTENSEQQFKHPLNLVTLVNNVGSQRYLYIFSPFSQISKHHCSTPADDRRTSDPIWCHTALPTS